MSQIQSLTALRGLAAIWIVLHHFWPQTASPTPYLIAKGYLAVDLFFILSGMVLFFVYADQMRNAQFDLKGFALKRFARLYPVHLVTLILAALILNIGPVFGFEGRTLADDQGQMFFLHLTLLHAWGLTETGGFNYPSWSLAAEAFAYVLFPLLAVFILKIRHALMISVLFLLSSMILTQLFWPAPLRNPDDALVFTRLENDFGVLRILPEFLLGLAIAKYTQGGGKGYKLHIMVIFFTAVGFAFNQDVFVVLGLAALLAYCVILNPETPAIFQYIGTLSYSLYMSHALVQIVGFKMIEAIFHYNDREVPLVFILPLLALTMSCALLLYYGCERPARRWLLSLAASESPAPKVARSCSM